MAIVPYIPSGYGNARLKFSCSGVAKVIGTSVGVFHDTKSPQDVATAYALAFDDLVIKDGARLGNSYTFLGVDYYATISPGNVILATHGMATVGTQGSPVCPPQCSLLVQKRTLFTGRANRGRGFYPGGMLIESEVSDAGVILAGVISGMTLDFEAWRAEMASDGEPMALLHMYDDADPSGGDLPSLITQMLPQGLIATQRRRLR